MTQPEMSDVVGVVQSAFLRAVEANIVDPNQGRQNRSRSSRFIAEVNRGLRELFSRPGYADRRIGVLSKGVDSNVPGLVIKQELLYDIHAFEYDLVHSPSNAAKICLIQGSLIQLESELANDPKEIATDFGKLVCGRADMKIMVMPRVERQFERTMDLMRGLALNILEPLYLILLPYPKNWQLRPGTCAEVYRFMLTDGGGLWNAIR